MLSCETDLPCRHCLTVHRSPTLCGKAQHPPCHVLHGASRQRWSPELTARSRRLAGADLKTRAICMGTGGSPTRTPPAGSSTRSNGQRAWVSDAATEAALLASAWGVAALLEDAVVAGVELLWLDGGAATRHGTAAGVLVASAIVAHPAAAQMEGRADAVVPTELLWPVALQPAPRRSAPPPTVTPPASVPWRLRSGCARRPCVGHSPPQGLPQGELARWWAGRPRHQSSWTPTALRTRPLWWTACWRRWSSPRPPGHGPRTWSAWSDCGGWSET